MMELTERDRRFMKMACDLASDNIDRGGGPFGAVIVRDGEVLATAGNSVTIDNDPTAHAEVNAIREACRRTKNFKLDHATIYCSCEPCPMCLCALYWAGVERIYYANTRADARDAGFDDDFIYNELDLPGEARSIACIRLTVEHAHDHFDKWVNDTEKIRY